MAAPEVVAAMAAMAACSCCDVPSTAAARSQEAAAAAWTVVRAASKSDRAMPEATDTTVIVSGSMGSGLALADK
jgi:hypothetical protein